MLKICHLADIHLGYRKYLRTSALGVNQREVDVAASFKEAILKIGQLNPDLVIIAGDLFHQIRPSNQTVTFAFRELRRLTSSVKTKVVIVSGNHETPKRSDTGNILKLFEEIPNIFVADSSQVTFAFKDISCAVTCLPHATLERNKINITAEDSCKYNLLVAHGQIGDSWISEFGGAEKDLAELSPNEFDYVALGHIHVQKQVGFNTWFSGATDHTSTNIWSESESPKGFLEVDLPQKKVRFHSLSSPRDVITLPPILGNTCSTSEDLIYKIKDSLENISGGIDGRIIRLQVLDLPKELYRQMKHKELKDYKQRALHLHLDIKFLSVENAALNDKSLMSSLKSGLSLKDQLIRFAKTLPPAESVNSEDLINVYESLFKKLEVKNEAS